MRMTRHVWILWAITLAFATALMILIPFKRSVTWWISACCTVLMFCLCAYSFFLAFRKDDALESKLLGWPVFRVGFFALIIQLVSGFLLMGFASLCPVWVAVIVEVVIIAATVFCLTEKDAAREAIRQGEADLRSDTASWKNIRLRAEGIASETGSAELRKLAEAIRYADPTPTEMDGQIAQMLETLSRCAEAENLRKTFLLIDKRKTLASMNKAKL